MCGHREALRWCEQALESSEACFRLRTHLNELLFVTQTVTQVLDVLSLGSNFIIFFRLQNVELLALTVQFSLEVL